MFFKILFSGRIYRRFANRMKNLAEDLKRGVLTENLEKNTYWFKSLLYFNTIYDSVP